LYDSQRALREWNDEKQIYGDSMGESLFCETKPGSQHEKGKTGLMICFAVWLHNKQG